MKMRLAIMTLLLLAGTARAENLMIVVSEADCRWLQAHTPAPDVAYVPGRDVHGRAVAPADLPGTPQLAIAERIPITLSIPLWKFLGRATPPLLSGAEVDAGTVTVDRKSGHVFYNGQPVSDPGRAELVAACRERDRRHHGGADRD